MKTEFDITLSVRDMYRFSIYHAYTGTHGISSVIIAALVFAVSYYTYGSIDRLYTVLYVLLGVIFLFYVPVSLYLRAKRQLLSSEVLQNALHYLVDDTGIHTSQKDATADLPWEQVYKVISTKHSVLVYSNRVNAYVIPLEQIPEQYGTFREIAKAHLPKYRFKMK